MSRVESHDCLLKLEMGGNIFYFEIGNGPAWPGMVDCDREIVKCRPGPLDRVQESSLKKVFFLFS